MTTATGTAFDTVSSKVVISVLQIQRRTAIELKSLMSEQEFRCRMDTLQSTSREFAIRIAGSTVPNDYAHIMHEIGWIGF